MPDASKPNKQDPVQQPVLNSTEHFLTSRAQLSRNEQLSEKLQSLRLQSEEKEAQQLATVLNLGYIDLQGFPIDGEVLSMISEKTAREVGVVAFFLQDDTIRLGTVNPMGGELVQIIKKFTEDEVSVELYLISGASFDRALKAYGNIVVTEEVSRDDVLEIGEVESSDIKEAVKKLEELKEDIQNIPISDLVGQIMRIGAGMDASDLHLEAKPNESVLRFRLDGVLQEITSFPLDVYDKIVSRLKLLASVKVNVKDVPQDGRFSIKTGKESVDLRFSSLPTAFGESVVIRFLGIGPELSLDQLGLRDEALATLKDAVSASLGLILTTGPTGSGKTTALYAALRHRMSPDVKIVTLENPVEIKVPGIQQVSIDADKGMTFASALRSVLRQDPDVVLVGEIRDSETAETAAQAAQTGHLVLSTLHANESSGAIPRLLGMGVRPAVIGPALAAIMAQRLVRRVCESCREEVSVEGKDLELLKEELGDLLPKGSLKMKAPKKDGCDACGGIGYKGRIGVYEIFRVENAMKKLIEERATAHDIKEAALAQGMVTMRQDGFLKVLDGITSIEEVDRVTKE